MLIVLLLTGILLCAAAQASAPACESQREENAHTRWLSMPLSRIVINPHGLGQITLPEGLAPSLKTDLAYYAGEKPIKLPCFWAWRVAGEQGVHPAAVIGPAADFSGKAPEKWATDRVQAKFKNGEMNVAITEADYGSASSEITVDLDATPYIVLQVADTDGQWALKVNDGAQPDVALEMGAWGPGTYTYDVKAATGWSGKKTFRVLLFAVGKPGSSTTFAGLRFVGTQKGAVELRETRISWAPHALESRAESADHGTGLESTIFFYGDSSIGQILRVAKGDPKTLVLTGQYSQMDASWDEKNNAVVLTGSSFSARIAVNRKARWLGTRDSWPGLLASKPKPNARSGVWAVAIDDLKAGDEIAAEARFAPAGEKLPENAPDLVKAHEALKKCEADWDKRLAAVPQPMDFNLRLVDAKGVTPDAIRRMYYKAWVFLLQDTLPPMPENGYPYPQVCCGKPSLWAEGHPKSRPSAQWESMIGMQFLSWADPETAWKSFEGMMSLVDKDGILNGEGLPSRHVQTAWMLYTATGDTRRLKAVYPALKRLLLWKISDPRWVFHDLTAPGRKDFEFVTHALIDAGFAIRIARALNMPEEAQFWQGKIKMLAADADKWFWDDEAKGPYEIYDANTGQRSVYHDAWNLQALALPAGLLSKDHEQSVVDFFKSTVNSNAPFAGTVLCKHPSYEFTMLGAWKRGLTGDAAVMAEAIMREITLAGEFSECYSFTFPPNPDGVIPSLFGVANIIDGTLWHNGVIAGDGLPIIARVPGAVGVDNIRLSGGTINVRFGKDDSLELSGNGLAGLRLPTGFAASEGPVWRGKLPVGEQVRLEAK